MKLLMSLFEIVFVIVVGFVGITLAIAVLMGLITLFGMWLGMFGVLLLLFVLMPVTAGIIIYAKDK